MKITNAIGNLKKIAEEVRNGFLEREDNYRFDLRDWSDQNLVYGMKYNPLIHECSREDGYNLGNIFNPTGESYQHYKFFRFKDLYKTYVDLWDDCGFKNMNIHEVPIERVITPILRVLGENGKYWQTIDGSEKGYRVCIFLYGGKTYEGMDLDELAKEFEERDRKEAIAINEYYNSRLEDVCNRILMG